MNVIKAVLFVGTALTVAACSYDATSPGPPTGGAAATDKVAPQPPAPKGPKAPSTMNSSEECRTPVVILSGRDSVVACEDG